MNDEIGPRVERLISAKAFQSIVFVFIALILGAFLQEEVFSTVDFFQPFVLAVSLLGSVLIGGFQLEPILAKAKVDLSDGIQKEELEEILRVVVREALKAILEEEAVTTDE